MYILRLFGSDFIEGGQFDGGGRSDLRFEILKVADVPYRGFSLNYLTIL
jgi:hypothetical protein